MPFVPRLLSLIFSSLLLFVTSQGTAQTPSTIRFQFVDAELPSIIANYAKASGQKFVVDATVRGRATILAEGEVPLDKAFELLSSALAVNGFAISTQGDTMVVQNARQIQRSFLPVSRQLPDLKPERLVSVIFKLKYTKADDLNKQMRILPSRDGEMVTFTPNNEIVVVDWVSNVHRIAAMINELDQKKK